MKKILKSIALASLAFVAVLLALPTQAQITGFNKNDYGPYDYNASSNWVGDTINGLWNNDLTLTTNQVVTFGADTTLTTPLFFNYGDATTAYTVSLISDTNTPRLLTLGGDITVSNLAAGANVAIGDETNEVNIDLGGVTRTIKIAAQPQFLYLKNSITNGGIVKTGPGYLGVSGSNSYDGYTFVTNGNLDVRNNNGLGSTVGYTTNKADGQLTTGGLLTFANNITVAENIVLDGTSEKNQFYHSMKSWDGSSNTLNGTITLLGNGQQRIGADPNSALTVNGAISRSVLYAPGAVNVQFNLAVGSNAWLDINGPLNLGSWAKGNNNIEIKGNASVSNQSCIVKISYPATYGLGGLLNYTSSIGNCTITDGGKLMLGCNNALATNKPLFIGASGGAVVGKDVATLDLNGFNQTVLNLNGYKNASTLTQAPEHRRLITNSAASGTSVFTVGTIVETNGGTFRGQIVDGATAMVSLVAGGYPGASLTLVGTNSYTGDTRIYSKLTLGTFAGLANESGPGYLSTGTAVIIEKGGQLIVARDTTNGGTYTFNHARLDAKGASAAVGADSAALVGQAGGPGVGGGIIDVVATTPINLTYTGPSSSGSVYSNPPLTVANSTLNLNSNQITVVVPGAALSNGTYRLIYTGNGISGSVNPTPLYTSGNGVASGLVGVVSIVGGSNVDLAVSCPTITLSPASLPGGWIGGSYSATVTASGGTGPYTYAVTAGGLPDGLSLTGNLLSGTPTASGSTNFTITVTDTAAGCTGSSNYSITILDCASLTLTPATLPGGAPAAAYSQTLTATGGSGGYTYAVTLGSLPGGLLLNPNTGVIAGTPVAAGVSTFTVQATDTNTACTASNSYTIAIDSELPKIKLLAPLAKKVVGSVGNPALVITGTASDKVGLSQVLIGLNNEPVTNVASLVVGTGVNSNWSFNWMPPISGSNTVVVKSVDLAGNESLSVTSTFRFAWYEPLSLIVTNDVGGTDGVAVTHSGSTSFGTVSNTAELAVGINYTIKVAPTTGYLYKNIESTAAATSTLTTYTFTMASNHVLTVNAVTNRYFDATNGTYYGLFWETNTGPTFTNAGFIKVTVKAKEGKAAKLSGTLDINGNRKGISGTFGLDGWGTSKPVDLSKWGNGMPVVRVCLPLDGPNLTFTGSVSNENNAWVSEISGYRSVPTSGFEGNYTLVVKGDPTNLLSVPGGDGFGLVTIDTNGVLKVSGSKLADGQTFSQKVGLSPSGEWAMYSRGDSAGGGQFNSMIMGWLGVNASTGITNNGPVSWIKTGAAVMYPGLDIETTVEGSPYFPADPLATPVLPWTNGMVTYQGGGIAAGTWTNSVTLSQATGVNKFTTDKFNKMTLGLTPKSGKLTVSFEYPAATKWKGYGAILTNQLGGSGYYGLNPLGTNTGHFKLEAAP